MVVLRDVRGHAVDLARRLASIPRLCREGARERREHQICTGAQLAGNSMPREITCRSTLTLFNDVERAPRAEHPADFLIGKSRLGAGGAARCFTSNRTSHWFARQTTLDNLAETAPYLRACHAQCSGCGRGRTRRLWSESGREADRLARAQDAERTGCAPAKGNLWVRLMRSDHEQSNEWCCSMYIQVAMDPVDA